MKRLILSLLAALFSCAAIAQEAAPGMVAHPGSVVYKNIFSNGPLNFRTLGTTTAGLQYNGNVASVSGDYNFFINGQKNLHITDSYANLNASYGGPVNGWPVISGGWGDKTNSGDAFAGMISVESLIYPGGTPTGLTLLIGAKGPTGEIHFVGNGALGHVTIDPPLGTQLGANDAYNLPNSIRFSGSYGSSDAVWPQIKSVVSGNGADAAVGMEFYNFGNAGYKFLMGNGTSAAFQIDYVAATTNAIHAASGTNPILWAGDSGGNRLILAGKDTGGVDLGDGGQYNGTAAQSLIASFNGGFEDADKLLVTAGNAANSGPTIAAAANGGDTTVPLNLTGLGAAGVVNIKGHAQASLGSSSAPTCGTGCTSITAGSTDLRGSFTTATTITSAILDFGTTYASAPFCTISDSSAAVVVDINAISTTALTVNFASSVSSVKVYYT